MQMTLKSSRCFFFWISREFTEKEIYFAFLPFKQTLYGESDISVCKYIQSLCYSSLSSLNRI